ncbi:hypothetical protein AABB02_33485 [Streptomyces rimosus]|uniref:hypothetical protein n=1 Tax=Streptomyces rimosus TaxID=1927 RepID=UPI0031D5CA71
MRILCTTPTRIAVAPQSFAELDAHHEYYLDDAVAADLIARGRAYALDAHGHRVTAEQSEATPARLAIAEALPSGPAGKPGSGRRTKATRPSDNKDTRAKASAPRPEPEPARDISGGPKPGADPATEAGNR